MKIIYNNENGYKEALKASLSENGNNSLKNRIKERIADIDFKTIYNKEDELLIDNVFSDEKFYKFRRFCRINKYKFLKDLNKDVLKKFESIKGIGRGKVNTIIHKLENIYSDKKYIKNKFCYFENMDFSNENQEIVHVFWQDKYSKFKEFCKNNNIKYIGELDSAVLSNFKHIKGIGETKINDILNVLKSYAVEDKNNNELFCVGEIYKYVKHLSLAEVCKILKIENNDNNILIKDIQGKKIKDINVKNKENLEQLLKALNSLKQPKEILEDFKNSLSDRTKFVLFQRYYGNKTLQDIANNYGLTRERVRQIISIGIDNLKSTIITENFTSSVRIYALVGNYIDYNRFLKVLGEDNLYIINILIKEEIVIKYYKEFGKIYLK